MEAKKTVTKIRQLVRGSMAGYCEPSHGPSYRQWRSYFAQRGRQLLTEKRHRLA